MRSLNTLADQGKILYLGVSDTPAWIVAKANQYALDHGLRPFVVYQGRWSAAQSTPTMSLPEVLGNPAIQQMTKKMCSALIQSIAILY